MGRSALDRHQVAGPGLAGRLPGPAALSAFRRVSAHAEAITFLALAALGVAGVILAIVHLIERRPAAA